MTERSALLGTGLLQAAATLLALVVVYIFLQDLITPNWPAWILAPLAVIGFRSVLSATPEHSAARAALWQVALILVPFMGVYGLLDAVFKSDGPVWIISPIVVLGMWALLAQVVDAESD
jgi:hypothetical protein